MRHLSEGMLRRVHDDSFAASNDERAHLAGCDRCRQRMSDVARDAQLATRLFAGTGDGRTAVEPALARLRSQFASGAATATGGPSAPRRIRSRRWALGVIAAPVLAVVLVVSANAAGWLSIFSPTTVAPISLTVGDVSGLPDLSGYGTMHVNQPDSHEVGSAAAAAAATGLPVLRPAVTADVPAQVRWQVIGTGSATFTLDASAANAAAARAGRAAPQIPSNLDGASVTVNAGPGVVAVYGGSATSGELGGANLPALIIGEGLRPTASTNGATLAQLEDFLVSQPSISPQLAAEIRAIGQPASTLPIPVIAGVMTSQTITIDGVRGVVTGDSTGLGTAVIWEKDGIVRVVAGALARSEVISIAQSLPVA
ncbi:MAG TPA: hypothetical protein VH661_08025 [Candidatus Dormibacteraeota bacterium]|nr:hypothetical protein [Candidatus Dormibacteraeota bacterium]